MANKESKRAPVAKPQPGERKSPGPRKVADVPAHVVNAIHCGERSTRNLVEALAVDCFIVAARLLQATGREDLRERLEEVRSERTAWTFPKAVAAIGNEFGRLRDYGHVDEPLSRRSFRIPATSFAPSAVSPRQRAKATRSERSSSG